MLISKGIGKGISTGDGGAVLSGVTKGAVSVGRARLVLGGEERRSRLQRSLCR
jgi:hypothetical protein